MEDTPAMDIDFTLPDDRGKSFIALLKNSVTCPRVPEGESYSLCP